ncbi:MAG: hypothetical protein ABIL40_11225 [candidate division WOR-3 bacterium]
MHNLLLLLVIGTLLVLFLIWLLSHWEWLPVILLVILWYIPRQAVPGGLLEDYLYLRWLTVFLIPMILFFQIFKIVRRKNCVMPPARFLIPLIMLSTTYIISGIINNVRFPEIIGSLLLYIRYSLLFFVLINMDLPEDKIQIFIKLFFLLLAIQIPECFYRYFVLGISGDLLSWTLGPYGQFDLGVYSIYAICLITAYGCINRFNWYKLLAMILLFTVAIMGEIKTFIISIPVISIAIVVYYFRNSKGIKRVLILGLPILLVLIVYYIVRLWGSVHTSSGNALQFYLQLVFQILSNPDMLFNPQGLSLETSRFLGHAFVLDYLKSNPLNLLLGAGPGSLMAGQFFGTPGKLFDVPQYLNQIAVIIGEVGIIGLFLFYIFYLNILILVIQPNVGSQNRFVKTIALAGVGMWLFYAFLGPWYDLVWRHDSPNFIFYYFSAYLYLQKLQNNQLRESVKYYNVK